MFMNKKKLVFFVSVLAVLTFAVIYQMAKKQVYTLSDGTEIIHDPYLRKGAELSLIYCGSCHVYPEPSLLPKSTWRFETLPAIAPFLGVDPFTGEGVRDTGNTNPYLPDHIYPSEPMVTPSEWQSIVDYYWYAAPDELTRDAPARGIIVDSMNFSAKVPEFNADTEPVVTSVTFDEQSGYIYVSNFSNLGFYIFDRDLNKIHLSALESPLSDLILIKTDSASVDNTFLATFIGSLYPSDAPYGSVRKGVFDPVLSEVVFDSVIIDNLVRPVGSQFADLNSDGTKEIIINEFGHRGGSISWIDTDMEFGSPEKQVLINTPGCIRSYILDFTGNGMKDIVSLCTQTDQAIYLFENEGNNRFNRVTLLNFEITAGSSSFELVDFDQDGYFDILYTSGDNADFSQIFKPYHGVYIYLNDGENGYEKKWFYPLHGAYNAKARDFTGNGNLDIAAISYFADYENSPEEGFIFFSNEGNYNFTPYHHPSTRAGRWLTMDVADWTGNGKYDILLGNASAGIFGPSDITEEILDTWRNGPLFMVLENHWD
jgi:hypothetical protein